MKKIKIYIVTYRATKDLNNNIQSLLESDLVNYNYEINVINNHSEFSLNSEFEGKVKVLHNVLRPDFSTGHLARNWNQAIINGFKDLNNPDCDILVTSQDDTLFKPDWCAKLIKYHEKYSFLTMGGGDAICSYLPEAVKKIGLWDERFCNIYYQEADYFLRATIYNNAKSSINDLQHKRVLNPIEGSKIGKNISNVASGKKSNSNENRAETPLVITPNNDDSRQLAHLESGKYAMTSYSIFKYKWGFHTPPYDWTDNFLKNLPKRTLSPNFFTYPYFEKDIEDLEKKNYIISTTRYRRPRGIKGSISKLFRQYILNSFYKIATNHKLLRFCESKIYKFTTK